MGGNYFSQLHVAGNRSLGEARLGRERGDEQGNSKILAGNGAPGRIQELRPSAWKAERNRIGSKPTSVKRGRVYFSMAVRGR